MRLSHVGGDPPRGWTNAGARQSRPRATLDRGSVTAETAVALPSLFLVALMLVWVLALVTAQMQCVDAARAGARVVSRGEDIAASEAAALAAAPDGATVSITRTGDFVRVLVSVAVEPPGGLLDFVPSVRVEGVAHAIAEDAIGMSAAAPGARTTASSLATTVGSSAAGAVVSSLEGTAGSSLAGESSDSSPRGSPIGAALDGSP